MEEELKFLVVGTIKSIEYAGGIKVGASIKDALINIDNWKLVDKTHQLINSISHWCFEFVTPDELEEYFIQVEVKTEFRTVTAFNVITNEEDRITAYSK
jgi:hypothetical protein